MSTPSTQRQLADQAASALPGRQPERTIGQLVADVSRDTSDLVRHEIALAKTELKDSAVKAGTGVGLFAAAALFGLVGFFLMWVTAAWGLVAAGLANWAAFGIVTLVLFIIAAILALVGKSKVSKVGPPQKAIDTAKKTADALKGVR